MEKVHCQGGGKEIPRNLIVLHLVKINCLENTAPKKISLRQKSSVPMTSRGKSR